MSRALASLACCTLAVVGCSQPASLPNVLLISIDTLRADRLSCAGYPRPTTPNLDELARGGLRFTHAQTPRAKTTPALASLFTGLYPHDHGVRDLATPIAGDVPLLQEALRAAGWRTGAIVANFVLQRRFAGLDRGFDLWVESLPDTHGIPPYDVPERRARSVTDAALVALGLEAPTTSSGPVEFEPRAHFVPEGQPWFLWLHYMDPHGAYDPPDAQRIFRTSDAEREWLTPQVGQVRDGRHAQRIAEQNVPPVARDGRGRIDASLVRDLYDGEVRYVDDEIGRLLSTLRRHRQFANTLIVIVADHGESLGEHDDWFDHGFSTYEPTCRVPLLVHFPGHWARRPDPGVSQVDLSLVDLAPTLLDWLDLPELPALQGASDLRGLSRALAVEARDALPHAVFCEKVERADLDGTVQVKAVRLGDWKLVRRFEVRASGAERGPQRLVPFADELYDLVADPGERNDLASAPPLSAPLEALRTELQRFVDADRNLGTLDRELARRRTELESSDPQAAQRLESLGY